MTIYSVLIISFLILSVLGTVLHFTHNWLKKGIILHIFSAINESTWEHMKMLVLPTLVVMIFQCIVWGNMYPNLFGSILVLYIVEIFSIPFLYEVLRFLFKRVHFVFTIIIFYIAIFLGIYSQYLVLKGNVLFMNEVISLILILLITVLFGIFTYFPPKIFLFRDPITKKYGDIGRGR